MPECCRIERNPARAMALHAHASVHMWTMPLKCFCSTFARCGNGRRVLDRQLLQDQNVWNSLIKGCSRKGQYQRSLDLYERMQKYDSLQPSKHTFVALLKACAQLKDVERGRRIHVHISRQGLVEKDAFIGSSLVDMYAKCGSFTKAQDVFYRLPVRNVITVTGLMTGYVDNRFWEEGLGCFEQMTNDGIYLDAVVYVCALKACGHAKARDKGQEIHMGLTSKGLERDLVVGSTLIDFYAKCSMLVEGQEVFDTLPDHDGVSWTALIAGYVESGHGEVALDLFKHMQQEGCVLDAATFVCSLKACGSIGATERGIEIHAEMIRRDFGGNFLVGSTLLDMYVKCGLLAKAQETFDNLATRDVISWTALITGYAQVGDSKNVFNIFCRMSEEGIRPNLATFNTVLNACSHTGLVYEGQMYLYTMMKDYNLVPTADHFTSIVGLLSRAGHIDRAFALIEQMPCHPVMATWHAGFVKS